ncbi:hypothetical protein BUALT_Bualt01G0073300 [Buddleja alternifolia]|uniref:Uncharacterized protein n=1 Tax=Buddleja alternifolia TaxID=168488 RepID=A0AAV6Y690_9LAMI|nr:hypothetical protein BUALT_Bualt01G0073300 [Buddleja alternifolia]
MECAKVTAGVRKPKKKQVKDELDRIKQAEKKKRRLEKALATSAAIRSELEKKKLKKKEEQKRLDEEGAAIAEAVALQVLLGEDSDESTKILLKKDEELTSWDHTTNINIILGGHYNDLSKYSCENIKRVDQYEHFWNHWGNSNLMGVSDHVGGRFYPRYFGEECWGSVGLSAGHLAAQAFSSLKIADDARVDAYVFNRILRG